MRLHIRPAQSADIPAITALLLADAAARCALNGDLWALAPDAQRRTLSALATISNAVTGPFIHHWLVAEAEGTIHGVTHGVNVPAPPIVDLAGGTAGVLLDDCHFGENERCSVRLLEATEQAMRGTGAVLFVAASPQDWTDRTGFLERAGYEPTTLYMAKSGLSSPVATPLVRRATEHDVQGIARLSSRHRARLEEANPVFWHIHEDADTRFEAWMATTLSLPDRSMFVSGPPDNIDGYIIAQPGSPLHFAPAHDPTRTGLIDDFYAAAFEEGSDRQVPLALVDAAEASFCAQGVDTALAICPVRMTAKAKLLEECGYCAANLWMVKS